MDFDREQIQPVDLTEPVRQAWFAYCRKHNVDLNHFDHRLPFAEGFSAGAAFGIQMSGHHAFSAGVIGKPEPGDNTGSSSLSTEGNAQ